MLFILILCMSWLNLQSINRKKNINAFCLTNESFLSFRNSLYYSQSDTFFENFRKQYSEKIAECSASCINSAMTYPLDDLWIESLMLANITEQFLKNYWAIFYKRTRGTWDLDNDSFRYKSSEPSTSSIILHSHIV